MSTQSDAIYKNIQGWIWSQHEKDGIKIKGMGTEISRENGERGE